MKLVGYAATIAAFLAVATSHALATPTTRLELEVAGMSCQGCADHVRQGLGALPGVVRVNADAKKARVVVVYRPAKITSAQIRRKIMALGYVVGDKDPPVTYPSNADVKLVSRRGELVAVQRTTARGKVTIVDFYADWCKPCKALERRIAARVRTNVARIALRKVNVVSWSSPVAKRYLKRVPGLPYIHIYDQRGRLVVALARDKVNRLDRYLHRLLGKAYRRPR